MTAETLDARLVDDLREFVSMGAGHAAAALQRDPPAIPDQFGLLERSALTELVPDAHSLHDILKAMRLAP